MPGDPVGSKRVYFNRENYTKLKELMNHDHPHSDAIQQFIMTIFDKFHAFLDEKKMSMEELFLLLEAGPAYVNTLTKTETSKQFKDVHYKFAEVWKKW